MIVHWGDDGLLIVFCRDGPRDDGEEGGRPQTDQCPGLQVQRTGPLTAGWGWWPRVIVYSVLFRNCMWIYSAVMSHIRFISLLADCNPLISYTCISEVAFEVRSSLFNCYMVVYGCTRELICWQLTAPLLDVIYSSEEKDKVAPFLSTLLYNVFPYLRNHR